MRLDILAIEVAEVAAEDQQVLELGEGALRHVEEPREVARMLAPRSLDDVRRNGGGGTANLRGQAEALVGGEPLCQLVDGQGKRMLRCQINRSV